jgi:hypothetical protein
VIVFGKVCWHLVRKVSDKTKDFWLAAGPVTPKALMEAAPWFNKDLQILDTLSCL